jgi:hypothetical protein
MPWSGFRDGFSSSPSEAGLERFGFGASKGWEKKGLSIYHAHIDKHIDKTITWWRQQYESPLRDIIFLNWR